MTVPIGDADAPRRDAPGGDSRDFLPCIWQNDDKVSGVNCGRPHGRPAKSAVVS